MNAYQKAAKKVIINFHLSSVELQEDLKIPNANIDTIFSDVYDIFVKFKKSLTEKDEFIDDQ